MTGTIAMGALIVLFLAGMVWLARLLGKFCAFNETPRRPTRTEPRCAVTCGRGDAVAPATLLPASDTWADQLRFVPWIEDGEGVAFNEAFQLSKFGGRERPDALAPAQPLSFHETGVEQP
jgi:hypothetical protein